MRQPSPAEIMDALRDYAVPLVLCDGWERRGTAYDASFSGHMNHHDAFSESVSDQSAIRLMINGRSDLPGPLCNGWGDSDGRYFLVAYGNANHAGRGEQDVLNRVRAGQAPTGDARLDPDGDSVVGNTWFWGTEWRNAGDGRDVWDQLDTMIRVNAALVDVFDWPNANVCIGHKEWTKRKIDPAGFDMAEFRRLVTARLSGSSPTPPAAPVDKEYDMNFPAVIVKSSDAADPKWYVTDGVTRQWVQTRSHAAILISQGAAKAQAGTGDQTKTAEIVPYTWPADAVKSIRLVS